MSDSPEHLDPKEATEAKLCAYLEGELPTLARAEIEQHLESNPQHRKLLVDLAQTRDWMRSIPREHAPSDLAESFQGQVERNMLLNDAGDIGTGLSMTRWPQYAMVAAIIVLVLGLGVTLVIILKGPAQLPVAMSGAPSAASRASETPGSTDVVMRSDRPAAATPPATETAPVVAAAMPPAPAPAIAPLMGAAHAAPPLPTGLIAGALDAEQIKTRLAAAGYRLPSQSRTVCFVVRSESPVATDGQVHDFFTRHQLLLEQPASLASNGNPPAQSYAAEKNTNAQTDAAAAKNATAGGANGNPQTAPANSQQQNSAQTGPTSNGEPNDGAPATSNAPGIPAETLFVAHGLSPLQLALLNASLAENNPNQPVNQFTLSEGSPAAAPVAPVPNSLAKGQTLTVTIPQLVGPGIEKTNVVKVADDGSISLPMIDPLQAVGITPFELEQRIAAKYREANLIPDAKVTVSAGPSTQPTTMPATVPMAAAPPMPRQLQLDKAVATSEPARDLGIDVVVVIEKAAGK